MSEEKERLMQQLDQARETMRALLAELDIQIEFYPGWRAKHLLAHIAGWDDAAASSLRAHAGGREPATPAVQGIDFYNAESVATRETLTYEHIVQEWELAREQLKVAILEMPDDLLDKPLLLPWGSTGTVAQIVAIFASHEKEHAEEIHALIHQTND
ncbi:MAG: maleylpyruvate isomerase N-terminal domain-containing protein [Anaerolineae bacterium]|jgi:hypothetical protein